MLVGVGFYAQLPLYHNVHCSICFRIATAYTALPTATRTDLTGAPETIEDLYKEFKHPSKKYRIQFLLRTNDEVRQKEIDWQVRSIREQGGAGVFSYCEHMQGGSPHPGR